MVKELTVWAQHLAVALVTVKTSIQILFCTTRSLVSSWPGEVPGLLYCFLFWIKSKSESHCFCAGELPSCLGDSGLLLEDLSGGACMVHARWASELTFCGNLFELGLGLSATVIGKLSCIAALVAQSPPHPSLLQNVLARKGSAGAEGGRRLPYLMGNVCCSNICFSLI